MLIIRTLQFVSALLNYSMPCLGLCFSSITRKVVGREFLEEVYALERETIG